MASCCTTTTTRFAPVEFSRKSRNSGHQKADFVDHKALFCNQIRCSASERDSACCTPVILEFRRLLQAQKNKNSVNAIPGVSNCDLLHAVIALYDVCLPDITPEVLYFSVCGKWAKTLLLIRDVKDVVADLKAKSRIQDDVNVNSASDAGISSNANNCHPVTSDLVCSDHELEDLQHEANNCVNGVVNRSAAKITNGGKHKPEVETETTEATKVEGEKKGLFVDVFSDTESEGSNSDEDEDEDFTDGQDVFLREVKERRERRQLALSQGRDPTPHVGIESRLVACATWEKSTVRPGEKNVQIDLLAVRKRFRKLGIGKYLIQTLKDPTVVGLYDALVVYADNSAIDFFNRFGFDDDIVLNSKFSDLADNWTNCTLMCYLPPFSGQTMLTEADAALDLKLMDLELQKWSVKSREAHQAQMVCAMKLKHEVISLRALVSSQQELIQSLTREFRQLSAEKFHMEKEFLKQQLSDLTRDVRRKAGFCTDQDDSPDDIETEDLIQDLEQKISGIGVADKDSTAHDACIDQQIAEDFKSSMDDSVMAGMCVISKTIKANVSSSALEMFQTRCSLLHDPSLCTKMYLCGTLQHPERIPHILANGFSEQDFSHGEFGVGLYFSHHASKAAHFSALGKLLLVNVGLGKTESVVQADNTRTAPSEGFDAIVTPGRLSLSEGDALIEECQEYVIFDPCQALPLYLIEYELQ